LTCTYLAKRLRELSSTKIGSYPHEFLCRTDCSACADYQPWINNLVWPRYLESFKGGNFNTLSLVDCYVQICNGTAVEHGSFLNCSGHRTVLPGCNSCRRHKTVQVQHHLFKWEPIHMFHRRLRTSLTFWMLNFDDLFCDYNTLTTVNSVTNTRTIQQTPMFHGCTITNLNITINKWKCAKLSAFKTFEVTGPHQVFAYC
jgi:hypothetical protein